MKTEIEITVEAGSGRKIIVELTKEQALPLLTCPPDEFMRKLVEIIRREKDRRGIVKRDR